MEPKKYTLSQKLHYHWPNIHKVLTISAYVAGVALAVKLAIVL